MQYEINQEVWVKCINSNAWVCGIVVGKTAKRIKVYNKARDLEGLYAPQNVKAK